MRRAAHQRLSRFLPDIGAEVASSAKYGIASSNSNVPNSSTTNPVNAMNVPNSLQGQTWSAADLGLPPASVRWNQSMFAPIAAGEMWSMGCVPGGVYNILAVPAATEP